MNKFEVLVHAQDISDIYWRNLAAAWQSEIRARLPYIDNERLIAESLRSKADYNTGSIPVSTAVALLILAREMQPERTFELGTFIGNSTRSLAIHSNHVWTCDGSNDIGLGLPNVTQYRKTMSTAALQAYKDANVGPVQLFFIDGRIMEGDTQLLRDITDAETVYALDDTYQLEKGIVNVNVIGNTLKDRSLYFLPAPRGEPFAHLGVPGHITLGLLFNAARMVLLKA